MDFYHVLNRGVDKRKVFLDIGDHIRFVRDLYELNTKAIAPSPVAIDRTKPARNALVDIHAWCLMPNHYHLLVSPVADDPANLSLFAKKINMGYSKFFNEKYKRVGALWQGKYKKIPVTRDAHFLYIPYYIHLNPLDLSMPEWREGRIQDAHAALEWLERYRWSSYADYIGRKNFPSLIERSAIRDILGSKKEQETTAADIMTNDQLAEDAGRLEK